MKLKSNGTVSEVDAKAYVSYEFGQAVKTRLSKPTLKVTTELPKQATTLEKFIPVRVQVANNGRVPLENVKLTETISTGFEYDRDSDGETTKDPLVRTWELGTIPAGTGKTIDFRVVAKAGRDLTVMSIADSGGVAQHSHDGKLHVHEMKLKVELRGDPQANDSVASFRADVTNEGTATLTNVRVTGSVPPDCRITSRTNGGQIGRDQVTWTITEARARRRGAIEMGNPLAGGGPQDHHRRSSERPRLARFAGRADDLLRCRGPKLGIALRSADGGDRPHRHVHGEAHEQWQRSGEGREAHDHPAAGGELRASHADSEKRTARRLTFDPRAVRPGSTEVFSITFRGEKAGQAFFNAKLAGESLGDKPMNAEKYVQITATR